MIDEKLKGILEGLPFTLIEEQLLPYLGVKSKQTYTVFNDYLMLGVKSVNSHYTKTHYALCLICMGNGGVFEDTISYGQNNQFKNKQPCGCSKIDRNFRKRVEKKVVTLLTNFPHITFVKETSERVYLNCSYHGDFDMSIKSFAGNKPKKFYCKKCYHVEVGCLIKAAHNKRPTEHFTYPFDKTKLKFKIGNTFKSKIGNTYTVVGNAVKGYVDVSCDKCKETNAIYKSNMKVGQIPCSCSGKSHKSIGDKVKTKHNNTLTIVEADSTHFWVECNVCHKDKELWPSPVKVLRGTVHSGGSPCSCAKSCLYTKEQYQVKVDRKLKSISCTDRVIYPKGRLTSKSRIKFYCETHKNYYEKGLQSFILGESKCTLCNPSKTGFDVNKRGFLYIMVFESFNDENHVFKVGITNGKPWKRLKRILSKTKAYSGFIYTVFELSSGQTCLDVENELKGVYAKSGQGALKVRFREGFTETFPWDLNTLQCLQADLVSLLGLDFTSGSYKFYNIIDREGEARLLHPDEYKRNIK